MKKYEAPEFIRIELMTENIMDGSIIDVENGNDSVVLGPPIDIFGKN